MNKKQKNIAPTSVVDYKCVVKLAKLSPEFINKALCGQIDFNTNTGKSALYTCINLLFISI